MLKLIQLFSPIYLAQICIFGTIANILNIIVLTRKDMSKTPINTILKWLAVADMFLMIEYIPFSIYMYIGPSEYRLSNKLVPNAHTHRINSCMYFVNLCNFVCFY